jgi:hypothetical protein
MQGVPNEIRRRQIVLFAKCDPAYGAGVAKAVKLEPLAADWLKGASAPPLLPPAFGYSNNKLKTGQGRRCTGFRLPMRSNI